MTSDPTQPVNTPNANHWIAREFPTFHSLILTPNAEVTGFLEDEKKKNGEQKIYEQINVRYAK